MPDYKVEILECAHAYQAAKLYQECCLLIIMSLPEKNQYFYEAIHLLNKWTTINQSKFIQPLKRAKYLEKLEGDIYKLLGGLQRERSTEEEPILIHNWYYSGMKYILSAST